MFPQFVDLLNRSDFNENNSRELLKTIGLSILSPLHALPSPVLLLNNKATSYHVLTVCQAWG